MTPTKVECAIDICQREPKARGWCDMHYQRWRKHGNPLRVDPSPKLPVLRGADNPKWKGDAAKYSAIHNRLRRYRGAAADHECGHCGKAAEDWAYDRTDPNELVDQDTGFPYSTDVRRYLPLCKPCHYRFDREGVAA